MTQRPVVRWHAVPGGLIWREWEGQLVVRSAASGSTHLLSASGTKVLLTLIQVDRPIGVAELMQQLLGVEEVDPAEIRGLEALLAEFEQLGLLERTCT